MAVHRITIAVQEQSIQVTPDTLVMNSLDEVHWTGTTSRRFSIVFDGPGPFDRSELDHDAAGAHRRPRATGRFKYSVVAAENPGLRLDPIIVVEEPPSDTNP